MSWKKIKLGDVIIKKSLRLKDVPEITDPLVLGVSNTEGVVKSKVDAGQKIQDYFIIDKGDFIYNPYRINVGSIGISDLQGIASLAYVVFNVDETKINKYLLYKFLKSDFGIKEIIKNSRGSVRNALRFDDLARIELTIPEIDIQNAFIVNFKKEEAKLDTLKKYYSDQLTQLSNLNQAILQEAVQGKLVPQDPTDEPATELLKRIKAEKEKSGKKDRSADKAGKPLPPIKLEEIPFEIPDSWVWCRLGEIIQYTDNLDIQKHLNPDTIVNYVDIDAIDNQNYTIKEAKQKKVLELSTRARRVLKKGFIAYSTVRPYLKNIAIVENELENYIGSTGFNVFKSIGSELKYVFYFLLTPCVNNLFKEMMVGFNSPSITNAQFENCLIPLPPLSEQRRIVVEIEKQFAKTKQLKEHIVANQQATEQLLKALLAEAFERKDQTATATT